MPETADVRRYEPGTSPRRDEIAEVRRRVRQTIERARLDYGAGAPRRGDDA